MDPNQPTPPTQPATPTVPPPAAQPIPPVEPNPAKEDKKMVMWFILGLIVIILIVAGVYLFLSRQNTELAPVEQPIPQATSSSENLEGEVNSIDVQTADEEFKAVDADLQTL